MTACFSYVFFFPVHCSGCISLFKSQCSWLQRQVELRKWTWSLSFSSQDCQGTDSGALADLQASDLRNGTTLFDTDLGNHMAGSGFRVWARSLGIGNIGSFVPFKILQAYAYASGNIIRSTEQSCTRGLTPQSVVCLSWVSPPDASSHGCGGV